ncbi:pilus assembly protein CpaB [Cytobacillus eiseniae]|uniref:Pilus assembly protein CpaB n=1 Tax=Cytobacillus eiseniae TaxID=762947 RepID=A0ABS4RFT9_9BACI|nr:SAF domain-containing protein [Cytobacillus eiseniae]MBP2241765.1 pilus assembly protein CpaB [Cytobacillus eiseniae]
MLESKRRAIIFISISLILALIAGYMFLQKVNELNANLGGTTTVYVAKEDINSRTIIKPDMVETVDLPNKFVTEAHVKNPKDITNKVSIVPLSAGDMVTLNLLKPFSEVGDPNHRLIALFANERVSFDQELDDLDRVDIVVSQQFEGEPKTEIFMTDVHVFRVDKSKNEFRGIALEVTKEEAPKLIHMQNYADSIRVLKANVGKEDILEQTEEKPVEKEAEKEVEVEKTNPPPDPAANAEQPPAQDVPAEGQNENTEQQNN